MMKVHNETRIVDNMPAIALRGLTVLPGTIIHFDVSRKKSIKAVEEAMLQDRRLFLVTQRDIDVENPGQEDLYKAGTIANIQQVIKVPGDIVRVLVKGEERAELLELQENKKFLVATVKAFTEIEETELSEEEQVEKEAQLRELEELFLRYCLENPRVGKSVSGQIDEFDKLSKLMEFICGNVPLTYEDKQKILEQADFQKRYETMTVLLQNEIHILKIRKDMQVKMRGKIEKNQKEYVLREQMRAIREELGEEDYLEEAEEWSEQVQKLNAPEEVKNKLFKEIKRFKSQHSGSSEAGVIQGYIETMLELPWDNMSKDSQNIKKASKILEADHYGLEKVKERVLEYLSVRAFNEKGEAPILCLVGPPGTGKTSIARSIARALNKEYVRISLGGVRDEAEIRGHRKTYVGAMPGRIINGLKQAGVKNPLMLLDEIDKLSSDYKGDTASALLEVLDGEQNCNFKDHYIEVPVDLSEVMFVATANSLQTISKPLLDRMEIIEVSSYTANEKFHIAKKYLIPKQLEKHGIKKSQLTINSKALEKIIQNYTREAGVRSLERMIGQICRKAARMFLEQEQTEVKVTAKNLKDFLGKEKYKDDSINKTDEVGIVRGLAWTSVGGDTLEIEVNIMPGKGEVSLTGQMGDVMQESAKTGISYIRSIGKKWNIDDEFFKKNDVHIHIPEGAVPKDGPSAGITMATAILSAVTNTPVSAKVAMTGEITLRGRVLPIGGLKEKMLAAKQAGIKKILVPADNEADVEEISEEIKGGMKLVFVQHMDEVIQEAFVKKN